MQDVIHDIVTEHHAWCYTRHYIGRRAYYYVKYLIHGVMQNVMHDTITDVMQIVMQDT